MKKILLAVMAIAAIGFTSCGNKTQQAGEAAEAVDSVAIVDSIAQGAAQETIDALSADLEANDVSKLQATLESIKVKIANADKVKALVGDNAAVAAALSAVTDIEPASVVNGLLEQVGDAATEVKDAAVDAANQKVEEAKQAAADKANEAKEAAKEKANEAIDNAAASAKSKLGL